MQPVQPVPSNTGTTTPTTRKNISSPVLSTPIDQEIAYLVAFKAAKTARLIESSSYADEYERVRDNFMSDSIKKLASMQMDMNKLSQFSDNATAHSASNVYTIPNTPKPKNVK